MKEKKYEKIHENMILTMIISGVAALITLWSMYIRIVLKENITLSVLLLIVELIMMIISSKAAQKCSEKILNIKIGVIKNE